MATIGGYTDGTAVTATELNAFFPVCALRSAGSLTVVPNTLTDLTYAVAANEISDALNWHSVTTNTARITPTISGYYRVTANYMVANTLGTQTLLYIVKNGNVVANEASDQSGTNPSGCSTSCVVYVDAAAGDWLASQAYHNNAANRTITTRLFSAHLLGT